MAMRFREKECVLAGDYILSQATYLLARIGHPRVIEIFAQVIEDLVRGTIADNYQYSTRPEKQALRTVQHHWIAFKRYTMGSLHYIGLTLDMNAWDFIDIQMHLLSLFDLHVEWVWLFLPIYMCGLLVGELMQLGMAQDPSQRFSNYLKKSEVRGLCVHCWWTWQRWNLHSWVCVRNE